MPIRYSKEEAQEIVRELSFHGTLVPTLHFEHESGPQRNFDMLDALRVIRSGMVISEPEYNEKHNSWKCEVEGKDIEGDRLTLIIAFNPDSRRLFIVTGW